MKLTVIALTALAAAAVTAVVLGATAIAKDDSPPARSLDHISNAGVRAAVSANAASALEGGGGKPELARLGVKDGLAFYVAPGAEGGLCYGVGAKSTGGVAVLVCPASGKPNVSFPSEVPVLDLSSISVGAEGATSVQSLTGFAADGVARVGVIDGSGVLHATDVTDNIYRTNVQAVGARALVAFDAEGREVYRRAYGSSAR